MRYNIIVLITAILLIPQASWAVSGAYVTGCATGGPLATPMGVATAANTAAATITASVERMGRSVSMEQRKIIASINTNFEGQNSVLRQIVASLGVSMEKMTNMRTYGPQSMAYGEGMVDGRLESVMTGRNAEDRLAGHFRESLDRHTREFTRRHERSIYYQQEDVSSISPEFFFPQNATLSADQLSKALFAIKSAVDPFPTPQLPERFLERGEGLGYEAQRKVKYSHLAMPSAVISDIVASYAPVMELGEWAEIMHENMGGADAPPQMVEGKISPMGYIDMMVNARFANQQWHSGEDGIHAMTDTGLLREMLVMESVNMEMQRRQMRFMQQTAGLLAQDQAMETGREFNESLNDAYRKVAR